MPKYQVTVTIDLVVELEAENKDQAEHEARQIDDAELWAMASSIQYEYAVSE